MRRGGGESARHVHSGTGPRHVTRGRARGPGPSRPRRCGRANRRTAHRPRAAWRGGAPTSGGRACAQSPRPRARVRAKLARRRRRSANGFAHLTHTMPVAGAPGPDQDAGRRWHRGHGARCHRRDAWAGPGPVPFRGPQRRQDARGSAPTASPWRAPHGLSAARGPR